MIIIKSKNKTLLTFPNVIEVSENLIFEMQKFTPLFNCHRP